MAGCGQLLKGEFGIRNFLLSHDNPHLFVNFQCNKSRHCFYGYVSWRMFWALYHTAWIIVTGVCSNQWAGPDPAQQVKWFIYLTDWCYFMLTVSDLWQLGIVVYVALKRKDIVNGDCSEMTWYLKTLWVLFNIATTGSILMSILFWSLVYSPSYPNTAVNVETHIINAVYCLLNLSVTGVPVRLYHVIHTMLYALVYVIFTVIYYAADGTNPSGKKYVYEVLDWSDAGTAVMYSAITILVAIPILHVILYFIHLARVVISRNCCRNTEDTFDLEMEKRRNEVERRY